MPNIYDNVEQTLLSALHEVMQHANAADFCVGYFNLRGWQHLADAADHLPGEDDSCVRILVGMQRPAEEEMREASRAIRRQEELDAPARARLHRKASESFRSQLDFGVPTNESEAALRQLCEHLRAGKVRVRLFIKYPLHAKLYLVHRPDPTTPLIAYVGSSNLTLAGLKNNGELNVDVKDDDAAEKLHQWFHRHWDDPYNIDISTELADLIESSWAADALVRPYLVYLKMVYHLSEDAREGANEFKMPADVGDKLLDFQVAAVRLAARHLHARGGVLLGDVVGLGKTLMAVSVARIIHEDEGGRTLVVCPKHLVPMWQEYAHTYDFGARIVPLSMVEKLLPEMPRYNLLIVDESHNLRNREGRRYHILRDYIERENPRCLLVTATPYNKEYTDLSSQLRLFVGEKKDLGVRPERYFAEMDEGEFVADYQASPRSLTAFEQSEYADDWRDLMRLYMVRRTRKFITDNYGQYDSERERYFVEFRDGRRQYFPLRRPHNLKFTLDDQDPEDQYARLYRQDVVDAINALSLPRYGLANYLDENRCQQLSAADQKVIEDLNRAGRRLMGFCRTNLFKRLESSGHSFLLSVKRHVIRNMIALHALENDLPVPIGTQDVAQLDTAVTDADTDTAEQEGFDYEADDAPVNGVDATPKCDLEALRQRAAGIYETYAKQYKRRFRWLDGTCFTPELCKALLADATALCALLQSAGEWEPSRDTKLDVLEKLLSRKHAKDKVIVFTQFADTASYLDDQLAQRKVKDLAAATGGKDPLPLARRFSPVSNEYTLKPGESELRVIVATDVLSEGQNLQDAHVIVNYDLPWAIIRLIQRAGRVDRIGQTHDTIHVYSYLPADGVERIISLHTRLRARLEQNNEVVGSDERFFGDKYENRIRDLYTERSHALEDMDDDLDVDLASLAFQVWNSASEADRKAAQALPSQVYATRRHEPKDNSPTGALVYLRTADDNDALVRVDTEGNVVSQSLSGVLREAACPPETKPLERDQRHHAWVEKAAVAAATDDRLTGGRLGPPRSTRRKAYERMKLFCDQNRGGLFAPPELERAVQAIYDHPLTSRARDTLSRLMRSGAADTTIAETVRDLYDAERLSVIAEQTEDREPKIVCSIGLRELPGDSHDD